MGTGITTSVLGESYPNEAHPRRSEQQLKVSEAVAEYLDMAGRKRADVTVRKYRDNLSVFVRMVGDRDIKRLTPRHVEDFFYGPGGIMDDHIVYRGGVKNWAPRVSESTHNSYRKILVTFFKWCRHRGYMKSDVMAEIDTLTVPKKHRQRPEPEKLLHMVDITDNDRDRILMALCVNTGLRGSEVTRIKVGDVYLDQGHIAVTIKKTGVVDEQPISLELDQELRAWLFAYAADLGRPLSPDDYLLPTRRGGLITGYTTDETGKRVPVRAGFKYDPAKQVAQPAKVVQKYLAALGMETWQEGVHTIRRAVARAYFDAAKESGYDGAMRETSALLHHASTKTTEHYLGLEAEVLKRDERIKGKSFLGAMIDRSNVVTLRPVG